MRRDKSIFRFLIMSMIFIIIAIILIINLISRTVENRRDSQFAGEISKLSEKSEKSNMVSTQIGERIEEAQKELNEDIEDELDEVNDITSEEKNGSNKNETEKNIKSSTKSNSKKEREEDVKQTNSDINKDEKNKEKKEKQEEKKENPKEENITFEVPVKGEIIKEFAKDSLVYSNTLQEWITHMGIDIKADKTSVVKAAANGKVTAIKNDPRYGLTVIVTHDGGYQTIYSNLLTSEFVVKGETIKAGQSIGTVGNSASFEIEDECHLHFELLKDNEYLDPTLYINFE